MHRPGFPIGAAATISELDRDPHPLLARLRAAEPVSWLPVLNGWLVTRHDLVLAVLRDAATFTVDDPRFSTAQVIGPSMLSLDGATHARHRDPFSRAFRPATTRAQFTAYVAAEVDRLITAMRPRGTAEIRGDLAGPLAVAVVARALGLREEGGAARVHVPRPQGGTPTPGGEFYAATVRSWYEAFVAAISDITAGRDPGTRHRRAYERLRAGVETALADGATLLAAAGADLSVADVVANAAVLMFGGIDTTEGMITNAVLHLLGHPDQLELVRAEPALLGDAIEESVRLEPSASVLDRYATRDSTLGGASIRRGDLVRISLAGAGRDPAVFPDPDRFDVRRDNLGKHLGFAHGPHFCFGAPLARLETHTALSGLLDRLPGLRLDPARPGRPEGLVFRKPTALHVLWNETGRPVRGR